MQHVSPETDHSWTCIFTHDNDCTVIIVISLILTCLANDEICIKMNIFAPKPYPEEVNIFFEEKVIWLLHKEMHEFVEPVQTEVQ